MDNRLQNSDLPGSGGRPAPTVAAVRSGPACPRRATWRPRRRTLAAALLVLLAVAGCAKYNTYYNAKKAFDDAEFVRDEAIRKHEDPPKPTGLQKSNYEKAIQKSQKVLDEYPGNDLSDDALFLQAKAWYRLEGYRMSIRKLDLLFLNFPATDYLEEALYLQGLNYLLIGSLDRSQEYLDQLERRFPDTRYRAETLKVSGDNFYALEQWDEAAEAYRAYLSGKADTSERERISLKLAQCLWETRRYDEAAEVLRDLGEKSTSAELGFRARLLRARVHVRIGDHAMASTLLAALAAEAEIYNARGEVRLAEAENALAEGRSDDAAALLESMPLDWQTPVVKVQASDMLGRLYVERGDWEQARTALQDALRRRNDLEDPDGTWALNETVRDYMAADQALIDARGPQAAELRVQKANALLFGLGRPQEAVALYAEAAADTAAAPDVAARALFGAMLIWSEHLDQPDSAAACAARLEARYPESPQAYEARMGTGSDLLGFLLERRSLEQAERYAALSPEEREILAGAAAEPFVEAGRGGAPGSRLRRRMVYLARRPNLVFEPTQDEIDRALRIAEIERARSARTAAADSVRAAAEAAVGVGAAGAVTPAPPRGAEVGGTEVDGAAPGGAAAAVADSTVQDAASAQADADQAKDEDKKDDTKDDKKDKKDKKDDGGFDLRAPRPAPGR